MILDFPYHNLHHYLQMKGLLQAKGEQLRRAKQAYRKLYQKAYRNNYAKAQLNIVLSKTELIHLTQKGKEFLLKPTQYLLHLIRQDQEGESTPPDLLIDIETSILQLLEYITRQVRKTPEARTQLIPIYQQLENLLNYFPK